MASATLMPVVRPSQYTGHSSFNMIPEDEYASHVSQPLTPAAGRPVDAQNEVKRINHQVYEGLKNSFNNNVTDAYFQSHPFDQMYTSHSLAVDEATLNNNYMRAIFGGNSDPAKDSVHMAYAHASQQNAEAPTGRVLYELNQSSFVEGKQATKDSLLETFADSRRYFAGQIDTDAERFMKARAGHELTEVTFYGKNVSGAGQAGRFHHLAGQHGHLQSRPNTEGLMSWCNLSSRTYAPDGQGGEVPLVIQGERGADPRTVPLTNELRAAVPDTPLTFNMNDTGSYAGAETDRYIQTYKDTNPLFTSLFQDSTQRRWV